MSYLSRVGFALSLVFGFLFLALLAELYYLLWWKKKRIIINSVVDVKLDDCINNNNNNSPRTRGREFVYMMSSFRTKPSFLASKAFDPQRLCSSARTADTQVYEPQSLSYPNQNNNNNNMWFREDVEDDDDDDEDDDEHSSLSVPPRFLFTIVEETKEDLESGDGGEGDSLSRRMSDLVLPPTPYLTPLASPTAYFTPPLTPPMSSNINNYGFNPLFESSSSSHDDDDDDDDGGKEDVISRRVQFHGSSSQVLPV